jgi:hypothetical protein
MIYTPTAQSGSQKVGSGITAKHYTKLERPFTDKHSSLFLTLVNYSRKNDLYSNGPEW